MMDGREIKRLSDEATYKAAKRKRAPLVVWDASTIEQDLRHIPFLGDYVKPGWEVCFDEDSDEKLFFVDSSGWGSPGERALTHEEFVAKVLVFLAEADKAYEYGFGIIETGQFQLYVRAYRKPVITRKRSVPRDTEGNEL